METMEKVVNSFLAAAFSVYFEQLAGVCLEPVDCLSDKILGNLGTLP